VHGAFWMAVAAEDKVKKEVKQSMDNEAAGNFGMPTGQNIFAQNEFQGGPMFPFFAANQQHDFNTRAQVDPVQQQRLEEDRMYEKIEGIFLNKKISID